MIPLEIRAISIPVEVVQRNRGPDSTSIACADWRYDRSVEWNDESKAFPHSNGDVAYSIRCSQSGEGPGVAGALKTRAWTGIHRAYDAIPFVSQDCHSYEFPRKM